MDLDLGEVRTAIRTQGPFALILLDTSALIWVHQAHRRCAALLRGGKRLYVSPASLLEIQFLLEAGRLKLRRGAVVMDLAGDDRLLLDDPPALNWFLGALGMSWTRDPFDRLIAAHALLRGWRLATSDEAILARLGPSATIEL